jgi:hypothetical protein
MQDNRMKTLGTVAAWSVAMLTPMMASASLVIGIDNNTILAAPNQKINIVATASGADLTNGIKQLDLYLQIDDGGPDNGGTASHVPTITTVDLTTGVFASNNAGNSGATESSDKLIYFDNVGTNGGTVPVGTNSVLGTITFDATGLEGATFDLYFGNVGANNNTFNNGPGIGSDSDYVNSSNLAEPYSGTFGQDGNYAPEVISVVPEPAAAGLVMVGASLAMLRRRQRVAH